MLKRSKKHSGGHESRSRSRHTSTSSSSSSSSSGSSSTKAKWIDENILRLECTTFVPSRRIKNRCSCGRTREDHFFLDTTLPENFPSRWRAKSHTTALPTDAYGVLEFQGGPHPTKARYIRLHFDTKPEDILQLLLHEWKLKVPNLVISMLGGLANFDLQPKLKQVFRNGLLKAAQTTGSWIITTGLDSGVAKQVGSSLSDFVHVRGSKIVALGIAPWGLVQNRNNLVGKDQICPYYSISSTTNNQSVLNENHNYFLLADNGTIEKYGGEIYLRRRLEHYLAQQAIDMRRFGGSKSRVPVVGVLVEGGMQAFRMVFELVTDKNPVPVVVCDGSGRAADLLAFMHRHANEEGDLPLELKEQVMNTMKRTFRISMAECSSLYTDMRLCLKRRDMIRVFRMGESDIDVVILTALLQGSKQNLTPVEQLSLTMAWNRPDIAKKHVFKHHLGWTAESLENTMLDALINDRLDFVKLLLENGLNIQKFLTKNRLEYLYSLRGLKGNESFRKVFTKIMGKSFDRISLRSVGQMLQHLIGNGYQHSYCQKSANSTTDAKMPISPTLDTNKQNANDTDCPYRYPYTELLQYALLTRRYETAVYMMHSGEESIAKALLAVKILRGLRKQLDKDFDVEYTNELKHWEGIFETEAVSLQEHCYLHDPDQAKRLLTYELKNFSKNTCVSLAYMCESKAFLSHVCTQSILNDLWYGGLKESEFVGGKITLILMATILPPFFPFLAYVFSRNAKFLEFKTREELALQPQTFEEYLDYMDTSSSSTSDDEDSLNAQNNFLLESITGSADKLNTVGEHIGEQRHVRMMDSGTTPNAQWMTTHSSCPDLANCVHQTHQHLPTANFSGSAALSTTMTSTKKEDDPNSIMFTQLESKKLKKKRFFNVFKNRNNLEGSLDELKPVNYSINQDTLSGHTAQSRKKSLQMVSTMPLLRTSRASYSYFNAAYPTFHQAPSTLFSKDESKTYSHQRPLSFIKKVYEFYSAPVTRYYLHLIMYMAFLVLFIGLSIITVEDYRKFYWLECVVYLHIVTYFLDKFRESVTLSGGITYFQKLKVHLNSFWNQYDYFMCLISIVGIILRYVAVIFVNNVLFLWGKNLLILCCALWLVRVIELMQIWRIVGSYIYMAVRMIKAMIPAVILLFIPLISFGVVRQGIMYPNNTEVTLQSFKGLLLKPYFMLYGEVYADEIDPEHWALDPPLKEFVPILMVIYLLIAIIVILSIIIAQFNDIFSGVRTQSELVYKYLRYGVIIEYESRPLMPPPLIVFSWIYILVRKLIRMKKRGGQMGEGMSAHSAGLKLFLNLEEIEILHDFEEECVEDYCREKRKQEANQQDKLIANINKISEFLQYRIDEVYQRQSFLTTGLDALDRQLIETTDRLDMAIDSLYLQVKRLHPNTFECGDKSSSYPITGWQPPIKDQASSSGSKHTVDRQASFVAPKRYSVRGDKHAESTASASRPNIRNRTISFTNYGKADSLSPDETSPPTTPSALSDKILRTNSLFSQRFNNLQRHEYTTICDNIDLGVLERIESPHSSEHNSQIDLAVQTNSREHELRKAEELEREEMRDVILTRLRQMSTNDTSRDNVCDIAYKRASLRRSISNLIISTDLEQERKIEDADRTCSAPSGLDTIYKNETPNEVTTQSNVTTLDSVITNSGADLPQPPRKSDSSRNNPTDHRYLILPPVGFSDEISPYNSDDSNNTRSDSAIYFTADMV